MSKTIFQRKGFAVGRFAGAELANGLGHMRMYQITTPDGKHVQMNVVEILNLREVLNAMCFDMPPCNDEELHTHPKEFYE